MNKQDLYNKVVEKTDYTKKDVETATNAVFEVIIEALANGEKVSISGFGEFESRQRNARTGRNPQTGEPVEIAAKKVPAFKPKKALKDAVNVQ
ncbi:HU family DNA-binding protein [Paenibacillus sp. XY044]|uniref:HU family DNA-binding protein n=1 Tax=Paenibacillus sp. XY044 TaxID=2026089 RepID=UPI000B99B8B0|nr:HU family DNA-binding protein [Paenibacillus sp. XY044]OZB98037.1 DNA-binding protein [Paenibacillus sp. XY044]